MLNLRDDWNVSGQNMSEFFSELTELEERTEIVERSRCSLGLLSLMTEEQAVPYVGEANAAYYSNNSWVALRLTNRNVSQPRRQICKLDKNGLDKYGINCDDKAALMKEVEDAGAMLLDCSTSEKFPMNTWAFRDLADRARCLSPAIASPSPNRDAFIVENMRSPQKVKLIIRKNGDLRKVFSIRGRAYKYVPQKTLVEETLEKLEDKLGVSKCVRWNITNNFTEILVAFPEKEEDLHDEYPEIPSMIPLIRIASSDTGYSSFKVTPGFLIGNSEVYHGGIEIAHDGGFNSEKFEKLLERKVFPELTEIPDRLSKLIGVDVNVADAIEEVFDFIKIEKRGGLKQLSKQLKQLLLVELSFGHHTAYDVVMALVTSPERLILTSPDGEPKDIPDSTMSIFRSCVSDAFWCEFNKSYVLV